MPRATIGGTADVSETVQLRADAEPAGEQVVVVRRVGYRGVAELLPRLHHLQAHASRRKGRRIFIDGDPQGIRLSALDELRSSENGSR